MKDSNYNPLVGKAILTSAATAILTRRSAGVAAAKMIELREYDRTTMLKAKPVDVRCNSEPRMQIFCCHVLKDKSNVYRIDNWDAKAGMPLWIGDPKWAAWEPNAQNGNANDMPSDLELEHAVGLLKLGPWCDLSRISRSIRSSHPHWHISQARLRKLFFRRDF